LSLNILPLRSRCVKSVGATPFFLDPFLYGQSAQWNNCADIAGGALQAAGLIGSDAMEKFPGIIESYMILISNDAKVSSIVEIGEWNEEDWEDLEYFIYEFEPKGHD
jgi:hypothetical protein